MDSKKLLFYCTFTFSIILEFCVRYFNWWNIIPFCDKIMHLFWGFNIFLLLVVMFKWKPRDALIGVFIWQMSWEMWEMIDDRIFPQPAYMLDHFYFDGIADTFTDLAGALIGWLLLFKAFKLDKNKLKSFWNDNFLHAFYGCITGVVVAGLILSFMYMRSQDVFALCGIAASFVISIAVWIIFKKKKK